MLHDRCGVNKSAGFWTAQITVWRILTFWMQPISFDDMGSSERANARDFNHPRERENLGFLSVWRRCTAS